MTIGTILKRKGTHVHSVTPDTSTRLAAERMSEFAIGSMVVIEPDGELVGIVAESDLLRAFCSQGANGAEIPVKDLVQLPCRTCSPDDTLNAVLAIMTRFRLRHLPVLASGALVGIVSIGDVVKSQLENLELEVGVLRDMARAHSA